MNIVRDNYFGEEFSKQLESYIYSDFSNIAWSLNINTNVEDPDRIYAVGNCKTVGSFQMVSPVNKDHPLYQTIADMVHSFASGHGIEVNNIFRIKINMVMQDVDSPPGTHHMPHIDSDGEHLVFLYYVNDSDGDTIFFNDRFNGSTPELGCVSEVVSPKSGRAVIFDGLQYHASSSPRYSKTRCVINVDFEQKENNE